MDAPPKPKSHKKKKQPAEGSVSDQISRVLLSKNSPVDDDEIAIEMYKQMGEAKGFVAKLMTDLDDQVRSPMRARVMDMILRMLTRHAEKNGAKQHDLATDEELESVAMSLMLKIGMQAPKEYEWPKHYVI